MDNEKQRKIVSEGNDRERKSDNIEKISVIRENQEQEEENLLMDSQDHLKCQKNKEQSIFYLKIKTNQSKIEQQQSHNFPVQKELDNNKNSEEQLADQNDEKTGEKNIEKQEQKIVTHQPINLHSNITYKTYLSIQDHPTYGQKSSKLFTQSPQQQKSPPQNDNQRMQKDCQTPYIKLGTHNQRPTADTNKLSSKQIKQLIIPNFVNQLKAQFREKQVNFAIQEQKKFKTQQKVHRITKQTFHLYQQNTKLDHQCEILRQEREMLRHQVQTQYAERVKIEKKLNKLLKLLKKGKKEKKQEQKQFARMDEFHHKLTKRMMHFQN